MVPTVGFPLLRSPTTLLVGLHDMGTLTSELKKSILLLVVAEPWWTTVFVAKARVILVVLFVRVPHSFAAFGYTKSTHPSVWVVVGTIVFTVQFLEGICFAPILPTFPRGVALFTELAWLELDLVAYLHLALLSPNRFQATLLAGRSIEDPMFET